MMALVMTGWVGDGDGDNSFGEVGVSDDSSGDDGDGNDGVSDDHTYDDGVGDGDISDGDAGDGGCVVSCSWPDLPETTTFSHTQVCDVTEA